MNTNIAQSEFTDQTDIPEWSDLAIESLLEKNIINGNDDGTLKPNQSINRAEFLKVLVAATQTALVTQSVRVFPDVATNDWFSPYVHTAVDRGWAKGYPDGTFKPGNSINRAEIAKLLTEAFDLPHEAQTTDVDWFDSYVRALADHEALPYQVFTDNFAAATAPSRIEVFEQLYRVLPTPTTTETEPLPEEIPVITEPLPTGQEVLTPAIDDEKYLTFTPTPKTTTTITPTNVNASTLSKGTKQTVQTNQDNVTLLELKLEGTHTLNGLQIRRIGSGDLTDFNQIWAESNGTAVTEKVTPQSDFVFLEMINPITLQNTQNIVIKTHISANAQSGNTSRWVLFLPDWIDSDALAKIGLFPLGGADITIK